MHRVVLTDGLDFVGILNADELKKHFWLEEGEDYGSRL